MKKLSQRLACSSTMLALLTPFALAQDNSANTGGKTQLDEIVVSAQKKNRAENLQDVPASITAYNETQLDEIIFQNLTDISYTIPNVSMEEVGTFAGVQNFSIRGKGINS